MPYAPHVKALAQILDPECWISYSGKEVSTKQALDVRRSAALAQAERYYALTNRLVYRVTAAERIYGPTAGQIEFNKIMQEIREGKHEMTPTRDAVFTALREVVVHPKLGHDVAKRIMYDHGHSATVAVRIPQEDYSLVYNVCRKALFLASREKDATTMPLLKIKLMLHFASVVGPFAPEPTRRSEAYVTFVRELLKDGMIERPTKAQRAANPGWAYKATLRGQCYVKALAELPLPVRTNPEWTMPPRSVAP